MCSLRWDQVDLAHGRLHVSRLKNGMASMHPLTGTELRALRRLQREQEPGRYLFMSERGAPMSAVGFRRMMGRLGKAAKMPFPVHPHMLRHACGFKLANDGQARGRYSTTWGTRTFSTPSDTPSCRPSGLRTFGRIRSSSGLFVASGTLACCGSYFRPTGGTRTRTNTPFRLGRVRGKILPPRTRDENEKIPPFCPYSPPAITQFH